MPLTNAKLVLAEAKTQLQEIEELYAQSLNERNVPQRLLVKIKNFLENTRSPLDYCANYIFDTFCARHIDPNRLNKKKKSCYFPNKPSLEDFNRNIDSEVFIGLRNDRPDIVSLFEKYQPFQTDVVWIKNLHALVNLNKHIDLTPQEKQIHHEHFLIDVKNSNVRDAKSESEFASLLKEKLNNAVSDLVQINVETDVFHPPLNKPVPDFTLTKTWVSILFTTLNVPVIPTLNEILSGLESIINDFEEVI